jgi:peptidoglycan/LPS O-acetylase OafA/YrhL
VGCGNGSKVETRNDYRPDIDGLRAVAVLAVVCFHAFPSLCPGGFAGVDVFFVISGFLISRLIFTGIIDARFSLVAFYAKRIKRIFPALVVVLTATMALGLYYLLPDEFQLLGKHTAAASVFLSNVLLWREVGYFDLAADQKPLLHLWSLGVEEQFYIAWPMIVLIGWRVLPKLGFILLFASVAVAAYLLSKSPTLAFYSPITRFWELLIGCMLAYATTVNSNWQKQIRHGIREHPNRSASLSIAGMALILGAFAFLDRNTPFPFPGALLPTLGAMCVMAAGPAALPNRMILASTPFVFVGLISYPLYLWHWPLLSLARIVEDQSPAAPVRAAVLFSSFVFAWLTYRFVEKPVRAGGSWAAISLMALLAAVGSAGYVFFRSELAYSLADPQLRLISEASADWGIPSGRLKELQFDGVRFWREGGGRQKAIFIGDSNLEQYIPRLDNLIANNPTSTKTAVYAFGGSCAPIPNVRWHLSSSDICQTLTNAAFKLALQDDVDTIVLAANWFAYFSDGYLYDNGDAAFDLGAGSVGSELSYRALEEKLKSFVAAGKKTVLVSNIPIGFALHPKSRIQRSLLTGIRVKAGGGIAKSELLAQYGSIRERLREIAARCGASVVDPIELLCTDKVCPAEDETGRPMYKDGIHLRASFVREKFTALDSTILLR